MNLTEAFFYVFLWIIWINSQPLFLISYTTPLCSLVKKNLAIPMNELEVGQPVSGQDRAVLILWYYKNKFFALNL